MWIERRQPQAATLEKERLACLEHDATAAVASSIPEYSGGVIAPHDDAKPLSEGVKRVAEFGVFSLLFSEAFRGWADDIEAAERGGNASQPSPLAESHSRQPFDPGEQPDNERKTRQNLPDNADVRDLCHLLAKKRGSGKPLIQIAREFTHETTGDSPKADSLLRQARRYSHLWKSDK